MLALWITPERGEGEARVGTGALAAVLLRAIRLSSRNAEQWGCCQQSTSLVTTSRSIQLRSSSQPPIFPALHEGNQMARG